MADIFVAPDCETARHSCESSGWTLYDCVPQENADGWVTYTCGIGGGGGGSDPNQPNYPYPPHTTPKPKSSPTRWWMWLLAGGTVAGGVYVIRRGTKRRRR